MVSDRETKQENCFLLRQFQPYPQRCREIIIAPLWRRPPPPTSCCFGGGLATLLPSQTALQSPSREATRMDSPTQKESRRRRGVGGGFDPPRRRAERTQKRNGLACGPGPPPPPPGTICSESILGTRVEVECLTRNIKYYLPKTIAPCAVPGLDRLEVGSCSRSGL